MEKKLILLVEDNPGDELLTRRALKKSHIPNEVVVARDGCKFGRNSYVAKAIDFKQFGDAAVNLGLYGLVLNEPAPIGRM